MKVYIERNNLQLELILIDRLQIYFQKCHSNNDIQCLEKENAEVEKLINAFPFNNLRDT